MNGQIALSNSISPSSHATPRQILGLDLLRFACALLVVTFHLGFLFWFPGTPAVSITHVEPFLSPAWPAIWYGWVAVQMFFVISGFVIAYSAKGSTAFKFFRDRLVRLGPALWICATISLAVYLAFHLRDTETAIRWYVKEMVLYPFKPWLDVVIWTLCVEISFYFLVFVLLCLERFRWIASLAAVLAFASLAFHLSKLFMGCDPAATDPFCSMLARNFQITFLTLLEHGCFFAIGLFLWLWLLERVPLRQLWWAPAAFVACVVQIVDVTAQIEAHAAVYQIVLPSHVPVLVWTAGVLSIVASVRFNEAFFRQLGERSRHAIRLVGLSTYPLYLVHWTSGGMFIWLLMQGGVGFTWSLVGAGTCLIVLSLLIAALVEPPFKSILRSSLNQLAAITETRWNRLTASFRSLLQLIARA